MTFQAVLFFYSTTYRMIVYCIENCSFTAIYNFVSTYSSSEISLLSCFKYALIFPKFDNSRFRYNIFKNAFFKFDAELDNSSNFSYCARESMIEKLVRTKSLKKIKINKKLKNKITPTSTKKVPTAF